MGTDRKREGSNPILNTLDSMRQYGLSLLILASLVLAPLLIAAPEALRTHAHGGVVYTTDQTWSGEMSLGEDVTIANGATLTIQAGTHLNVTEDVTITIDGDLEIQGSAEEPVEIWGSWIADTSIQARWQGFLLSCLLYTSPRPQDATLSRMQSSA